MVSVATQNLILASPSPCTAYWKALLHQTITFGNIQRRWFLWLVFCLCTKYPFFFWAVTRSTSITTLDPTLSLLLVLKVQSFNIARYAFTYSHVVGSHTVRSGSPRVCDDSARTTMALPLLSDALGAPALHGCYANQCRWCFDRHMHWLLIHQVVNNRTTAQIVPDKITRHSTFQRDVRLSLHTFLAKWLTSGCKKLLLAPTWFYYLKSDLFLPCDSWLNPQHKRVICLTFLANPSAQRPDF